MCIVAIFVANQRHQVYLCACRAPADCCAIRVMLLPTFSKMCPCLLLAGTHVNLGGDPFIHPQYRHAMSNKPLLRGKVCMRVKPEGLVRVGKGLNT